MLKQIDNMLYNEVSVQKYQDIKKDSSEGISFDLRKIGIKYIDFFDGHEILFSIRKEILKEKF